MKFLLLTIVIAACLVGVLPLVLNSKYSPFTKKPGPAPAPAVVGTTGPTSSSKDGWTKHPSGLGGNGGLGIASISESAAGSIRVYTPDKLPEVRDGQVVRLRFSRPEIVLGDFDADNYSVSLTDKDHGGVTVIFPKVGARKMALPYGKLQPGLSFYVALDPGGLRAAGTTWRPDTRTYTW